MLAVVGLVLLPLAGAIFNLGTLQSVAVKGRVLCDGEPMKNVKLKLYEVENSEFYCIFHKSGIRHRSVRRIFGGGVQLCAFLVQ